MRAGRRVRGWAGVWLTVLLVPALPTPGAAQQQEQQVDSARLRVLERLRALARGPGADSLLFLQDSLALAEREEGRMRSTAGSGADSVVSALLRMPGFALTEYEGGRADFGAAERVLVLGASEGERARVRREGMEVQADTSITYSEVTGRVRTVGQSTFTPPGGEAVESVGLIYDLQGGVGSALDAKTAYSQQGATWYVTGDMPLAAQDSSFLSHARFTSCDLTDPHYHFETDQIKIVGGKVLVARPVRLYFADVPVAWLPFMAQSLSSGRASGLLTPAFSINDIVRNSTGYRRRISNLGFYWAMSDYSDAILALDWFSGNYTALTSQLRYRWNRQFLGGDINVRQYWRETGQTELAVNTQHSWEMDERTALRVSGNYVTSTSFVEEQSFNPAEVTQSINSQGGINRRFDWGTMSVSANRQQYLSDERITMTLPAVNLNLSTITLFRAPANRANFWNNMTWSGRAKFDRRTLDRLQPDTFDIRQVDTEARSSAVSSNLTLGSLTFSQSLDLNQDLSLGVPERYLENDTLPIPTTEPSRSITDETLRWSFSMSYLQPLIGSTTLTPNVSFSGDAFRSDTSTVAGDFLAAPTRTSFGASLKTDIYGFWPGFGGFSDIRHKLSPTFTYAWTPEVAPTELQREFFGASAQRPSKTLRIGLNQTFEAKRAEPSDTSEASGAPADTAAAAVDTATDPSRQQRAEIVQLLGLNTSVVNYDFVRRDTLGSFLAGFGTTILSNQITSDYLRGLSISMDHDLFADSLEGGRLVSRSFSPHLAQINLGFSVGSSSRIFRWLGGGGDEPVEEEEELEEEADTLGFTSAGVDEASIIPGTRGPDRGTRRGARTSRSGWNANLSYSLTRPRNESVPASQILNGTVTLRPTDSWDMSWRTSYDLERGEFNDHFIRLTRDLHRWEAHFDFVKTVTGNWQFRFEVALTDNRDLNFDYQQRSLDTGRTGRAGAR